MTEGDRPHGDIRTIVNDETEAIFSVRIALFKKELSSLAGSSKFLQRWLNPLGIEKER